MGKTFTQTCIIESLPSLRYPIHFTALVDNSKKLLPYGSKSLSITTPSNPISLDYSDSESEEASEEVLMHETAQSSAGMTAAGDIRRGLSVERLDRRREDTDAIIAGISVLSHSDIERGTIGTCRAAHKDRPGVFRAS